MPRTGSIFFSGSDPSFVHRKDSDWRIEERGGTWQKYLRSIVPTTILVDYIIFLHCILLSSYLLARLIIIRLQYMGFRTVKEKLITYTYHLFKNATIYHSQSALISWLTHNAWFLRLQNPEEIVRTKPYLTNSRNLLRHFSFPNFLILSFGTIFFSENSSEMHRKLFQ